MGRVSKYKKIKQPFKKILEKDEKTEIDFTKEEKLPLKLRNILKEKKKWKEKGNSKKKKKIDNKNINKLEGIKKGEDYIQFTNRITKETINQLKNIQMKKLTKKAEKKKNFLKEKKKKKKNKRKRNNENNESEDEIDSKLNQHEEIKFGEVVNQPPSFTVLPKRKKLMTENLSISSPISSKIKIKKTSLENSNNNNKINKEIENLRKQVIENYKKIKLKKQLQKNIRKENQNKNNL